MTERSMVSNCLETPILSLPLPAIKNIQRMLTNSKTMFCPLRLMDREGAGGKARQE